MQKPTGRDDSATHRGGLRAQGTASSLDPALKDGAGALARAQLLILWHSRTGAAHQMARAAASAARLAARQLDGSDTLRVRLLAAHRAAPADLLAADAYLFCAPENLAALSGAMKDCLDRCYYPLLGQVDGRPYGVMVSAGTDGAGAVRQLTRICTGWRLRPVADPVIVLTGADTPAAIAAPKQLGTDALAPCRALGGTLAGLLLLG